jgi:hypothetical protein
MAAERRELAAKLPPLNIFLHDSLVEKVNSIGTTIEAFLDEVGIHRGQYYGWKRDNKFEPEPLRRLLKKLKRLGLNLPTTDPHKLRQQHYYFDFTNLRMVRERKGISLAERKDASLEALWGANPGRNVQAQLEARRAVATFRHLNDKCYLLMFTCTVYPLIYRFGEGLLNITEALADALNKGARIMVFLPSHKLLKQIKTRLGPEGVLELHEFADGMQECRQTVRRLMMDKKEHQEAVIESRLYTHFGQIVCDSHFMTCATGRVTVLIGDNTDSKNRKFWGAERFADDSMIVYSGKGEITSMWTRRIRCEASHFLWREIKLLRAARAAGTLTSLQKLRLKGAVYLYRMLISEEDLNNE